ncbi:hypothetical protein [Puniceibacterium sediminis]|uniref:Sulfotransferase family protein n=1 Tax=Puniceibacterium sediminis TaxID=1608407 RepID=A0A238YUI4_9RHOB|nr:hypothetical protein [Puniceibacterium sediminis]SNR74371.1 hypothetical protein SAMN06265370_1207 [Puniceibacterium sediminis]
MTRAISIALWTHPRSISTAFERYFLERKDFQVFHEEFAAVYQANDSREKLPHGTLDPTLPGDYASIRDRMEQARQNGPVFHKDMCYHVLGNLIDDHEYLANQVNIFLVRSPEEAVLSLATVHPGMDFDCIGYAEVPVLFDHVRQATGRTPMVIDSAQLASDPVGTMRAVCDYAGIDFDPHALSWGAAMPPVWQTWETWHAEAAQSTTITAPKKQYSVSFESQPRLRAMADFCQPFYAHMQRFSSPIKTRTEELI